MAVEVVAVEVVEVVVAVELVAAVLANLQSGMTGPDLRHVGIPAFYVDSITYSDYLAEREEFEPAVPREGQLISSRPRSATPAPLRARSGRPARGAVW